MQVPPNRWATVSHRSLLSQPQDHLDAEGGTPHVSQLLRRLSISRSFLCSLAAVLLFCLKEDA